MNKRLPRRSSRIKQLNRAILKILSLSKPLPHRLAKARVTHSLSKVAPLVNSKLLKTAKILRVRPVLSRSLPFRPASSTQMQMRQSSGTQGSTLATCFASGSLSWAKANTLWVSTAVAALMKTIPSTGAARALKRLSWALMERAVG